MKKTVFVVVTWRAQVLLWAGLIAIGAVSGPTLMAASQNRSRPLAGYRVLVDPGHGGIDSGTGARYGVEEKDINLDVAFRLGKRLEKLGARVYMTRSQDQELSYLLPHEPGGRHSRDLRSRVHLAHHIGCTLLVSLHVNSTGETAERGSIALYYRESEEGRRLGEAVQARLLEIQPYSRQKALPFSSLRLLRTTECPAVLIEMGFISNPEDRRLLMTWQYREKVAVAISAAIIDYVTRDSKAETKE